MLAILLDDKVATGKSKILQLQGKLEAYKEMANTNPVDQSVVTA